jgi:hypothetical protein
MEQDNATPESNNEPNRGLVPTNQPSFSKIKGRRLTDVLLYVAEETMRIENPQDSSEVIEMKRLELLARSVWHTILTGKIMLIDGSEMRIQSRDHLDLMKWVYNQIDGPAPKIVEEIEQKALPPQIIEQPPIQPEQQPILILSDAERARRISELINAAGTRRTRPDTPE